MILSRIFNKNLIVKYSRNNNIKFSRIKQQSIFIKLLSTKIMLTNHNFNINLTEKEESIVNLLVNCAKWIEKNPQEVDNLRLKDENDEWIGKLRGNEPLELRIAGGWVRDKVSIVHA